MSWFELRGLINRRIEASSTIVSNAIGNVSLIYNARSRVWDRFVTATVFLSFVIVNGINSFHPSQ